MNTMCILKIKNLRSTKRFVRNILPINTILPEIKALMVLCVFGLGLLNSCNSDSTVTLVGNWVKRSDLDGVARGDAASFVIGSKGYLCGGYDGKTRLKDLWEYNPDGNSWSQKASLPTEASARNSATGFSIGSKGYIGNGYDGDTYLKDFWEYDPSGNSWTRKADYGGTARYNSVGFASNTAGYVGTGFDGNYQKDFWKLDPAANTWVQVASIPGSKRTGAFVFIIDNKAYVGGGVDNGTYVDDFNYFDLSSETWVEKRRIAAVSTESYDDDYTQIVRAYGVGFAINGKGYVATGESSGNTSLVWEYDPSTDLWTKKQGFEGSGRSAAVGFDFGTRGFISTGRSSSYRFDDLWEFKPMDEYNSND